MKAIILAAGYATRLAEITDKLDLPKPLLPIAGKPIIEHIIDSASAIPGIDQWVVVSNAKYYQKFNDWAADYSSETPIKILNDGSTSNDNRLGAIKDIYFALDTANINEDVLVLAGDNMLEFDMRPMYETFIKRNAAVIGAYDVGDIEIVKNKHGVVVLDSDNRVTDFQEKPAEPKSSVKSFACYLFKQGIRGDLTEYLDSGNPDAPGFFIEWLCKKQPVFAHLIAGKVHDIGNPDSYKAADRYFSKKP